MLLISVLEMSHMNRPVLGGRTPLEVMTGRKPKSAVNIVLWCGKYLKDATSITANLDLAGEGPLQGPRRGIRCDAHRNQGCDYVETTQSVRQGSKE